MTTSAGAKTATQDQRALLRHLVATLAYRAAKVLRDVPSGFGEFSNGPATRRPLQIVAHLGDLMGWALRMAQGDPSWIPAGSDDWDTEVRRFFDGLAALDQSLVSAEPPGDALKMLIQGPLADALTHVGQLAMLRGSAGSPVRPESYARAEIVAGRVGSDQAPARREFEGDASSRR